MSSDDNAPQHLVIPEERKPHWRPWLIAMGVAGAMGIWAVGAGVRPSRLWSSTPPPLETLEVDRGDVGLVVTENGALESADIAVMRCQVEALMGLTGGGVAGAAGSRGGNQGAQGQGGGQGNTGAGGAAQQAGGAPAPAAAAPAKGKAQMKGGAAKAGGAKAKVTGAGVASKSTTSTAGAQGGAAGGTGGTAGMDAAGANQVGIKRPDIRSFDYIVEPHIPLRGAAKPAVNNNQAAAKQKQQQQQQGGRGGGGGGGGRGGGGGGGGGGQNGQMEMPGSTRIISILPEGSKVSAGDVVCELDSSAFRDEVQAQRIRYIQAKAWVEQAISILDVNEISLREYRDGIYPQDVQLLRQYISACRTEEERARANLIWSRDAAKKGFRANSQVKADALGHQQALIALQEAEGMERRLVKYTMPRIMKARHAKIQAIKADKSSQESAFQLETVRLKRLEAMVENCTMRAPRDGIVVYANQSNSWGRVEAQIQEGVTVRQTQPIFSVPDPRNMRVKARVNESKTGLIHSGQRVRIRVDAFPDRPMDGTVAEITPIPAPASVSNLDVQVYYATVNIDSGGFDELRPGLSAEVDFLVENHSQVTRVPVEAIRWVSDQAYAAVTRQTPAGPSWQWKRVSIGLSDSKYAEVLAGLKPGDRVIARPTSLPRPADRVAGTGSKVDRTPRG